MFGEDKKEQDAGIIPWAAQYIFDQIQNTHLSTEFQVNCSMIELYWENIRDLVNGEWGMKIKEDK